MNIKNLVNEELTVMIGEVDKKAPEIYEKLEKLYKKLAESGALCEREEFGQDVPKFEKRIAIETVSKLIEVPRNELVLYFLNHVKTKPERSLIEMHAGQIYFYGY